jgi:hypothetical protein
MQFTEDGSGQRKLSFSFRRMIGNAVPNFANSSTDDSISAKDLDDLFYFQQAVSPPQKLIATSLTVAKVTQEDKTGGKVVDKLQKLGILSDTAPYVNTTKIDKHLPNQLPWISSFAQKRLVCVLFDWEEEVRRIAVLEEEENEIRLVDIPKALADGTPSTGLEERLMEIKGLKELKPSLRNSKGDEELPQYEQVSGRQ